MAPHRQEDAEEGPGKGRLPRPPEHPGRAPDRTRSALRPLRPDLRAVAERRHRGPAGASSSCATTPRPRSWSTTTSRASSGRTRTARRRWWTVDSNSSGTSTGTAIPSPGHARCSSTASSSNPVRRSTRTFGPRPVTRSSGSAARSSSGPETADRPRTSRIRTCCARS